MGSGWPRDPGSRRPTSTLAGEPRLATPVGTWTTALPGPRSSAKAPTISTRASAAQWSRSRDCRWSRRSPRRSSRPSRKSRPCRRVPTQSWSWAGRKRPRHNGARSPKRHRAARAPRAQRPKRRSRGPRPLRPSALPAARCNGPATTPSRLRRPTHQRKRRDTRPRRQQRSGSG